MKHTFKRLMLTVLATLLVLSLVACENSPQKQQQIISTFDSFGYTDRYILVTAHELRIGDRVIDLNSITYDGKRCSITMVNGEGAYAWTCADEEERSINILYVPYDTLEAMLLATHALPDHVIHDEYYNGKLYFRTSNPKSSFYGHLCLVYDIATGAIETVPAASLPYDIEKAADNNRSEQFSLMRGKTEDDENTLFVTKKATGETKTVDNSLLTTCEEGRKIVALGERDLGTHCHTAFERDGVIYVLFLYVTDGAFGWPCHYYIMKYDFDSHTLQYYTSIFFVEYPDYFDDFYIPAEVDPQ